MKQNKENLINYPLSKQMRDLTMRNLTPEQRAEIKT